MTGSAVVIAGALLTRSATPQTALRFQPLCGGRLHLAMSLMSKAFLATPINTPLVEENVGMNDPRCEGAKRVPHRHEKIARVTEKGTRVLLTSGCSSRVAHFPPSGGTYQAQ